MAIKFHQKYPERSNAPSTEYPSGSFRNRSDASAHDGTFLDETWANDKYGFFVKLLKEAGIEPDGTVDNAVKSQYFDALKAIIANETGMKELTGTSVNDVQTDGTYKIGKDVTGLPFDATSLIVAGKTGQIAISKDKMAFRVIGGQWVNVGDVDLSEYRKLDDNRFTKSLVAQAVDDTGVGLFLMCKDGNIRGQMVTNNYGLQFSQVQADGSHQNFTFPRYGEGGEISVATTKVVSTEDELHDALLRGDSSIYVTSKSGYITLTKPITGIKPNTVLSFDPALTVRDNYTGGFTFNLKGELGEEVKLTADAVSGDRTITVESTSSLNVGDWVLLKSNQACSHESAGDWQLGETTGSNAHVYFGEPKQIESIEGNIIKLSSTILFPSYKANGADTAISRANSTIQKLSTIKGITINAPCRWEKGKGFVFNSVLLEDADINFTDIQKDGSRGTQVVHRKCLNSRFTVKHTRPTGWSLGSEDHSLFNSVKEVGSWWCETNLIDINGCQGADQTYEDVPSLFPRFNVKSFNNIEDGATSHGNSFGGRFIIESYGSILCGFRNRSRFCEEVDVTVTGASYGIVASAFGAHNNTFKIHATNVRDGVRILHKGVTQVSPARKDLVITGSIKARCADGRYAIMLDDLEDGQDKLALSGISLRNLTVSGFERTVRGGKYVNGISFDNVKIECTKNVAPIYLPLSSGHRFGNMYVELPEGSTVNAVFGTKNPLAGNVKLVDYNTLSPNAFVVNGTMYSGTENYFSTSQNISSTTSNTAYIVRGGSDVYLNVTRNDKPQGVRLSLNATTIGECELDITLTGEGLGSDVIGVFGVAGTNIVWSGTQSSKVSGGLSLKGTVTLRLKVFKDTVLVDCP